MKHLLKIINPETGKKVSIYGSEGKKIINKYLQMLGGAVNQNLEFNNLTDVVSFFDNSSDERAIEVRIQPNFHGKSNWIIQNHGWEYEFNEDEDEDGEEINDLFLLDIEDRLEEPEVVDFTDNTHYRIFYVRDVEDEPENNELPMAPQQDILYEDDDLSLEELQNEFSQLQNNDEELENLLRRYGEL